jgi:hypothetical protein
VEDEVVLDVEASDEVASTGRGRTEDAVGVGVEMTPDIMRFWNSLYLVCRWSSGEAFRAIPSVYAPSASFRLNYKELVCVLRGTFNTNAHRPSRSRTAAYSSYSKAKFAPISLTIKNLYMIVGFSTKLA